MEASRGLSADGNDHILLLIDGHPQNSIVGQGFQQQSLLPTLDKVKRIEIIRGPGSVLWGSSAALGVINVITKDGSEFSGTRSSIAYGNGDGMRSATFMDSFRSDGGITGIVSVSAWKSDGYDRPDRRGTAPAWNTSSPEEIADVKANVEFPWGKDPDWPPLDRQSEGYEIYTKVQLGQGGVLLGRLVESALVYPWDTWIGNPGSELRMRKSYLSYLKHLDVNPRLAIDTTVYVDMLLQNRFPEDDALFKESSGENRTRMQDQSSEETAVGAEVTASYQLSDNNVLKLGTKAVRTKIGPNRDSRFDVSANQPASTNYPYLGVESGYDNNLATYFEDAWTFNNGRTTLFGGGRVDDDDFREDKTVWLPRGGLIHSLSDSLTAKYVYNSGYLRPNAVYSKTAGIIVDTARGPNQSFLVVDQSERVASHEVGLFWKRNRFNLAGTLFYMMIDDYISFDANNLPQGYKNLGDAESRGVEVEWRYNIRADLVLYGNYSLALAELKSAQNRGALSDDHDATLNYPEHIFNLGIDWLISDQRSLNVHLNGWRDMNIVEPLNAEGTGGQFATLRGEEYVDLNYMSAPKWNWMKANDINVDILFCRFCSFLFSM